MQRYFLENAVMQNNWIIDGDDAKHIARVMRMNIGDFLIVVTTDGAFEAQITAIHDRSVEVKKVSDVLPSSEMPVHVTICCGLPKGDKLDLIIQKGTELGMYGIVPFQSERAVVKWEGSKADKKLERFRKIAKEAAEQSHRSHLPIVENVVNLKQLIEKSNAYDHVFFADEEHAKEEGRSSFAEHLKNVYKEQSLLVIFGPEGGISDKEREAFLNAHFVPIALGPRILRAETAPLYVLSAISYEFE